jgi:hypothetical protein
MLMSEGRIVKRFFAAAQGHLKQIGLRKRRGLFRWAVQEDVLGSLGLNYATYGGGHMVDINPVVGVTQLGVERLVAELGPPKSPKYKEYEFPKYVPATYCAPLGYLTPENTFRQWTFWANEASAKAFDERWVDWDDVFRDMLGAFQRYGMPFAEKYASLPALCQEMAAGQHGHPGVRPYRLPVACFLVGDVAGARAALNDEIARREEQISKASGEGREHAERYLADYRQFVDRLLARFETH